MVGRNCPKWSSPWLDECGLAPPNGIDHQPRVWLSRRESDEGGCDETVDPSHDPGGAGRHCSERRGHGSSRAAGSGARGVLRQLGPLRARLLRQADPCRQAQRDRLRVCRADGYRDMRAERRVVRLSGPHVERRRQRRRHRRRPVQSGSAPLRQLQPAREAEGGAPERQGRDVPRRLDALEVLLRRRGDERFAPRVRAFVHRPHPRGQPPDGRLADAGRRRRRRSRSTPASIPGTAPTIRRRTGTTPRCCCRSFDASSTRTARRRASTTCSRPTSRPGT